MASAHDWGDEQAEVAVPPDQGSESPVASPPLPPQADWDAGVVDTSIELEQPKRQIRYRQPAFVTYKTDEGFVAFGDVTLAKAVDSSHECPITITIDAREKNQDTYISIMGTIATERTDGTLLVSHVNPTLTFYGATLDERYVNAWTIEPSLTLFEKENLPPDSDLDSDEEYKALLEQDKSLACVELTTKTKPTMTALRNQVALSPSADEHLKDFSKIAEASVVRIYFVAPRDFDPDDITLVREAMKKEYRPEYSRFLSMYSHAGDLFNLNRLQFKSVVPDHKLGPRRNIEGRVTFRDFTDYIVTMYDATNREHQAAQRQIAAVMESEARMWLLPTNIPHQYIGLIEHDQGALVKKVLKVGDACKNFQDLESAKRNEAEDSKWHANYTLLPAKELFANVAVVFHFSEEDPLPNNWVKSVINSISDQATTPSSPVYIRADSVDTPTRNILNGLALLINGGPEYDELKRLLLGNDLHAETTISLFKKVRNQKRKTYSDSLSGEQQKCFEALGNMWSGLTPILGPPGCGKTETMAKVIIAVVPKMKFVVGAASNRATNEIALRVKDHVKVCRLTSVALAISRLKKMAAKQLRLHKRNNRQSTTYTADHLNHDEDTMEQNKLFVKNIWRARGDKAKELDLAVRYRIRLSNAYKNATEAEIALDDRILSFIEGLPSDYTIEQQCDAQRIAFSYSVTTGLAEATEPDTPDTMTGAAPTTSAGAITNDATTETPATIPEDAAVTSTSVITRETAAESPETVTEDAATETPPTTTEDAATETLPTTTEDATAEEVDPDQIEETQDVNKNTEDLGELDIKAMLDAVISYKHDGRIDPELRNTVLEVRMLEWAGLAEGTAATPVYGKDDTELQAKFKEAWEKSTTDSAEFADGLLENVAFRTLESMDVIANPLSSWYGLKSISESVGCIIIDEAGQCTEPEAVAGVATFPHAAKVIIGDHLQLNPTVLTLSFLVEATGDNAENNDEDKPVRAEAPRNDFARQLSMSFLERLTRMGYETRIIGTQFRMVPQIASIVRDLLYQGQLVDDPSTAVENHPTAMEFQRFILDTYSLNEKSWIFLNVTDGATCQEGTSKFNPANAQIGLKAVTELVKRGMKQIKYITPYAAQVRHVNEELVKLKIPSEVSVEVSTVDSAQGTEAEIVVLDLVSCASKARDASFIRQFHRLNVGLTRAKFGLIFVGSKDPATALESTDNLARQQLYDLIIHTAIANGHYMSVSSDGSDIPEDANIVAPKVVKVRECYHCKESGHVKKDCPKKDEPQVQVCKRCHEIGHIKKECPIKECRKCHKTGHEKSECPDIICTRCGEHGHIKNNCSNKKNPYICHRCGVEGHGSGGCPTNKAKPAGGDDPWNASKDLGGEVVNEVTPKNDNWGGDAGCDASENTAW